MNKKEKELLLETITNYKGNIPIILNSRRKKSLYNMLNDEKLKRKILIKNDAGILGNLLYKYKEQLTKEMIKLACLKDLKKYQIDFEKLPPINKKMLRRMFNDKDLAMQILEIEKNNHLVKYFPTKFKNNKEFHFEAIKRGCFFIRSSMRY